MERIIGPKSRNFCTPPVFSALTGGDSVEISGRCMMLIKLEWLGYRMVKNYYVKPFSSDIGTSRTDRQTDRIAISISRSRFWPGWTSRDQKWKSCIGQTSSSIERISCLKFYLPNIRNSLLLQIRLTTISLSSALKNLGLPLHITTLLPRFNYSIHHVCTFFYL